MLSGQILVGRRLARAVERFLAAGALRDSVLRDEVEEALRLFRRLSGD
jgi:hypothetical protein